MKTKTRRGGRQLPGWGHVSNPQNWKVVDEAPDEPTTNGTGGTRNAALLKVVSWTVCGVFRART